MGCLRDQGTLLAKPSTMGADVNSVITLVDPAKSVHPECKVRVIISRACSDIEECGEIPNGGLDDTEKRFG